jgi:hypothetical protein
VERLAQLMLAVPDVSRCLLQQLLGDVRRRRQQQQQQQEGADQAPEEVCFSDADVARFQAGLRQCLDGVLNIKVWGDRPCCSAALSTLNPSGPSRRPCC